MEDASARRDMPITQEESAPFAVKSPMPSLSMVPAQCAPMAASITEMEVAPVPLAKFLKELLVWVSANQMNSLIPMETATLAETIRLFPMVNASAELATLSTAAAFALCPAEVVNSPTKEDALSALSIPSTKLRLMAADVRTDTTKTTSESARKLS